MRREEGRGGVVGDGGEARDREGKEWEGEEGREWEGRGGEGNQYLTTVDPQAKPRRGQ